MDPLATGLLLIVAGETVKRQDHFMGGRKTYRARIRFGISTDTDDLAGKVAGEVPLSALDRVAEEDLRGAFRRLTGSLEQRVPRYSAVKVEGRPLYEWARKGLDVRLPVKTVQVYRFDLLSYARPEADVVVECSKGTYVRALARDAGESLGTGAVLSFLSRETIGPFSRADAYAWDGRMSADQDRLMRSFIPHEKLDFSGDEGRGGGKA